MGTPRRLLVCALTGTLLATGAVVVPATPSVAGPALATTASTEEVEPSTTEVPLTIVAPPAPGPDPESATPEPELEPNDEPTDGGEVLQDEGTDGPAGELDQPQDDAVPAPGAGEPAAPAPSSDPDPDPTDTSGMRPFSIDPAPAVLSAEAEADGFAVVGVVWDDTDDTAVTSVEIRTLDGEVWSDWEEIPQEPSEKDPEGQTSGTLDGTDPMVVGDVDRVEVRLTAASAPTGARLSVIDPGTSGADTTSAVSQSAVTTAGGPPILPRSAWGADESMMTWTPRQGEVTGAVIHHTAGTNNYTADQVPSIIRGIYAFHAQTRGWGDIGYNFLVDKYGRIWEGRSGGVTLATVGAHAVNYNSAMTGISVMGDYTSTAISGAAWDSVADLTAWKLSIHGVRSTDRTTVNGGNYPAIVGHRDVGQTSCPGQQIYGRLGELRNYIGARQAAYEDIFGSARGNFVQAPGDSTIYLVVDGTRHAVADYATLLAYQNLGSVASVSASYVRSLPQGKTLGRLARNAASGEVSFVDSSIRLRLPSCAMATDYGSSCDAAVNLTSQQLSRLTAGPEMTRGYVTTNGKLFYVENGKRREAFDGAAVTASGISTGYVRLSESGISGLPYGAPILRPDVIVRDRSTALAYIYTGSRLMTVAVPVVNQTAMKNQPQSSMDTASLSQLPSSGWFRGYARPASGSARYLMTNAGLLDITGMSGFADSQFVIMPDSWIARYSRFPSSQGTFVRAASNPRIFMRDGKEFRGVLTGQDKIDLTRPATARVFYLSDLSTAQFRTGADIPSPGTLVKSSNSAEVFMVDGFSRRVPVEVFEVTRALGLGSSVKTLPAANLNALSVAPAALSPFVTCNGMAMAGARGVVRPHSLGSAVGPGLPVTTLTAQTCGRLPIAWTPLTGPTFVKATNAAPVYRVLRGRKSAMTSWAQVTTLAGNGDPQIYPLGPSALAKMP